MNFYRSLFAAAALFAATTGSAQDRCRAMLNGAPENVLQLEAVRDCRGTDAACGYMGSASGHGALTRNTRERDLLLERASRCRPA